MKSMIKDYINKLRRHKAQSTSEATNHLYHSFSQCGEDRIVDYIFRLRSVERPSFIDIGAHHPFYLNNTAIFYEKGCRGVNVEANSKLLDLFKHSRPEDTNINIGVSSKPGFMDFYIMEDESLSTFSKSEYEAMQSLGKKLTQIKKIKLDTVSNIIETHCSGIFPDFMSLDIEGFDFEILQSIDFGVSSPKVVCVEAAEYSSVGCGKRRDELIQLLVSKGYYEYANTNLNAIMVKNEFWFI